MQFVGLERGLTNNCRSLASGFPSFPRCHYSVAVADDSKLVFMVRVSSMEGFHVVPITWVERGVKCGSDGFFLYYNRGLCSTYTQLRGRASFHSDANNSLFGSHSCIVMMCRAIAINPISCFIAQLESMEYR